MAVTDHDAVGGVAAARAAAVGGGVEVVAGVEITAEFRGRELHLLGYFFRTDDGPLTAALAKGSPRPHGALRGDGGAITGVRRVP